jgi:hypothetical protein
MGPFFYYLIMDYFLKIDFGTSSLLGDIIFFFLKLITICTTDNQHFFAKCLFIKKKKGLTISIVEE